MDSPTLTNAIYWLGWMTVLRNVAVGLVIAGVALEFVQGWLSDGWRRTVENARTIEIARLNAEAEQARASIASAHAGAAEATRTAAEATQRATEARLELAKFKAPRTLTAEQDATLVSHLRAGKGQKYSLSVATGSEPASFMCTLDSALQSAGWKKEAPIGDLTINTDCGDAGLNTVSGIDIRVAPGAKADAVSHASLLGSALRSVGIEPHTSRDPVNVKDHDMVWLLVGAKE